MIFLRMYAAWRSYNHRIIITLHRTLQESRDQKATSYLSTLNLATTVLPTLEVSMRPGGNSRTPRNIFMQAPNTTITLDDNLVTHDIRGGVGNLGIR